MDKFNILHSAYKNVLRPYLFTLDAEKADDLLVRTGEYLENSERFLENVFAFKNPKLHKKLLGIEFENPIGLAAGLDYNGHLAKTMKHLGFGFNTIGSVTAKPYSGNSPPRLTRLVKSESLLVNKGFKSDGAVAVAKRLDKKNLNGHTIGISVGNSNIPQVNTLYKAIDDYLFTFDLFGKKPYVKYFELNISCPNITIRQAFTDVNNINLLVTKVRNLGLKQPIFVKMHNEMAFDKSDEVIRTCLKESVNGFVFSNLIGNRQNRAFHKSEIESIRSLKGGLSGKPAFDGSNKQIAHARRTFGKNIVIVGCGGVFSYQDAITKLMAGADLIQLVTGLIFEGPQIAGDICSKIITP
jgi:dihydroorotate dehydrogenase subfamily 2